MSGFSPVEVRLRAVLEECILSGLPVPDEETWCRRFPGHAGVVSAVFAEFRASSGADGPDAQPVSAETPPSDHEVVPPETDSQPVWAEEPDALETLREDAHGTLRREADGTLVYELPAARLDGRNSASEYLARARRLAAADVDGVQTPEVSSTKDGSASVRFAPLPERAVSFRVAASQRRGATRRALDIAGRVATRICSLHAQGAAHGRLGLDALRIETATRQLIIGTGLEDGPGVDGESLEAQQINDVRALGALLYGALALEGTEPDPREIIARHDAHELPSLAGRRPDLSRALVRLVDRSLRGGRIGGFSSADEQLRALDLIRDHESPDLAPAAEPKALRPRLLTAAATIALLSILAACHFLGGSEHEDQARLAVRSSTAERVHEIRALIDSGRHDDAVRAWRQLARDMGLDTGVAGTDPRPELTAVISSGGR